MRITEKTACSNQFLKQNSFKFLSRTILSTIAVSYSAFFNLSISAEENNNNTAKEDNKVTVIGTRIKKIDISNLAPILSISREDMDDQGHASVKDVIDGLSQNTGGTIDNSFTTGFTPGASAVNLRGIGFGHTLVLIDGRRLPIYPIGIGGTQNFVDLSSIPVAFVERIDVLTDGASAVYGSDAVSGVINIITRKEIEGIALNYRIGESTDGGYKTKRLNLLTGARSGDTQVDLIIDFWEQGALWAQERDYANSDIANPLGQYSAGGASFYGLESQTVYQHPNCGTSDDPLGGLGIPDSSGFLFNAGESWCGFDRTPYRQLIAPQRRGSVMSRLAYEINSDLLFFGRVGISNTDTDIQSEPNFYGGSIFDGFGTAVENNGGILPAGAVNNPTTGTSFEEEGVFIRRLLEFGPRRSSIDNNSYNFLAGLEGTLGGGQFDWEFGISYNKTDLTITSNNVLLSALNQSVDLGLDLFEPIPNAVVNALSFNAIQQAESSNQVVDFLITGDLGFGFDAGPVKFALAAENVTEKYTDTPDPRLEQGDAFGGSSSGGGKRDHFGIGGELSFPFSDNFELDIALRWDDYNDDSSVGNAFSPRVALGYRPFKNWLTRFSWGKSFRAPDMQRLFGGPTEGFVDLTDPEILLDASGNRCSSIDDDPSCRAALAQSVRVFTLSNIDLKEEKGNNLNLGVIWEPNNDFSISLDYFKVELEDVVTAPSAQWIVDVCSEFDVLCDLIERNDQGLLNGGDSYVVTFALNFAEQDTDGIDMTINYDWQNSWGNWSSTLSTTWVSSFKTRLTPNSAERNGVNFGDLPEFRTNLNLDWRNDRWGATLRVNYIDEVAGLFCAVCEADDYIDSWTTYSLNGRYDITDFTKIRFGINNLTNEAPPQDPTQVTWPWFINGGGYYSAVGRETYLQIETYF